MLNRHFSAWVILPQSSISILSKDYPAKKQRHVGSVRLVGFFSNKWLWASIAMAPTVFWSEELAKLIRIAGAK